MNIDLKVRKCRGCDKIMIGKGEDFHLMYCKECHERYSHLMGQYDN